MKAIVFHNYGSPHVPKLEEVELPTPGNDELLVKIRELWTLWQVPVCKVDCGGRFLMTKVKRTLTLDRPVTYEIKVPGHFDESWSNWTGRMTIVVESAGGVGRPVTTLTALSTKLHCTVYCVAFAPWVCR